MVNQNLEYSFKQYLKNTQTQGLTCKNFAIITCVNYYSGTSGVAKLLECAFEIRVGDVLYLTCQNLHLLNKFGYSQSRQEDVRYYLKSDNPQCLPVCIDYASVIIIENNNQKQTNSINVYKVVSDKQNELIARMKQEGQKRNPER